VEDFYFLREIKDIFVVEEYIDFDYEASVIVVKNKDKILAYPLHTISIKRVFWYIIMVQLRMERSLR